MALSDTAIYPSHERNSRYLKLGPIRSDILARSGIAGVFTGAYRFRRFLLERLAAKYGATLQAYTEEEGENALVLGPEDCQRALSSPAGEAMRKVSQFLGPTPPANILGILVLEADGSDENRQKFLLRTRKRVYLRDHSLGLTSWPAKNVHIGRSGLSVKGQPCLERTPLDARFAEWHRELALLEAPPLRQWAFTHPFAESLAALTAEEASSAAMPYMQLLTAVAKAGNSLDAFTVLRLEALAASLGMSEESFATLLKAKQSTPAAGAAKLQKRLNSALAAMRAVEPHVLFLDILETAHTLDGKCRCPDMVEILRSEEYAGQEFTRHACESVSNARRAQLALAAAVRPLRNSGQLFGQHCYQDSLTCTLFNWGGKIS